MFKKLDKMNIGQRLKSSFRQIIIIFVAVLVVMAAAMIYLINDYSKILDNYAYPQGDIAMAMNESAILKLN